MVRSLDTTKDGLGVNLQDIRDRRRASEWWKLSTQPSSRADYPKTYLAHVSGTIPNKRLEGA